MVLLLLTMLGLLYVIYRASVGDGGIGVPITMPVAALSSPPSSYYIQNNPWYNLHQQQTTKNNGAIFILAKRHKSDHSEYKKTLEGEKIGSVWDGKKKHQIFNMASVMLVASLVASLYHMSLYPNCIV